MRSEASFPLRAIDDFKSEAAYIRMNNEQSFAIPVVLGLGYCGAQSQIFCITTFFEIILL